MLQMILLQMVMNRLRHTKYLRNHGTDDEYWECIIDSNTMRMLLRLQMMMNRLRHTKWFRNLGTETSMLWHLWVGLVETIRLWHLWVGRVETIRLWHLGGPGREYQPLRPGRRQNGHDEIFMIYPIQKRKTYVLQFSWFDSFLCLKSFFRR